MTRPLWLAESGPMGLLNFVVDRLDAADAQGKSLGRAIKLDAKSFPSLFKAEYEEERERQWSYLEQMVSWGWFQLSLDRVRPGHARYECNPRVTVSAELEIRQSVGRPVRVHSASEVWREAVNFFLVADERTKELVTKFRIEIPGKNPGEIVQKLSLMSSLRDEPLLLREISARLFWGQSKVLDGRQALVAALLQEDECPFPEMPVQLQVFLPNDGFTGVLFIENQATFEQATRDVSGRYAGLALVFASGFKGSAKRLRAPSGASVYFASHGMLDEKQTTKFLGWLRAGVRLPSWFWGDLDYSGMRILAALRGVFEGLAAWEPGYKPMLERLSAGIGHAPDEAGKGKQMPIVFTGCPYADSQLLPVVQNMGMFLDQEMV